MYRVGWPGWKIAGRFGVPLLIRLEVLSDKDAHVYVVTSRDLPGMIAEVPFGSSVEEMHRHINDCALLLLEEQLSPKAHAKTVTAWPGEFAAA